jgi:MFS family permease
MMKMDKPVIIGWRKLPNIKELFSLNRILNVLILSDFIILSAYGFIAPIFAIFLTEKIIGGTLVVVGIAEAVYLGAKSLLQVPIGIYIDRTEGQKLDFWLLFTGNLMMSVGLFLYLFAQFPWHIYLISLFFGVGNALAYPAWTGLFTRNIVENRESFAWSYSTTVVELGSAVAAAVGAAIAQFLGFNILFIIVGLVSVLGTFSLFFFYRELKES